LKKENPDAGEAAIDAQPIAPEKIHPLVQTIIYGSVGNFAQNSHDVHQRVNMDVSQDELANLVRELAKHLEELNLDLHQQERVKAQIGTLKAELAGAPDSGIVHQAGRTLRNLTEGAIAGLLANAVQPTVWNWIHQVLGKF
jgi:hypothetical protein